MPQFVFSYPGVEMRAIIRLLTISPVNTAILNRIIDIELKVDPPCYKLIPLKLMKAMAISPVMIIAIPRPRIPSGILE